MRLALAAIAAISLTFVTPMAAAADLTEAEIAVTPATIEVDLGDRATIEVTISNTSDADLSDAVAHIDITDLTGGGSVDPEDWSSTLSRALDPVPAGQSRRIQWELQPISPGTFTLYAVALSGESDAVAVSETVTISVADRRSLNPNGILPIAVGAPLVVGAVLGLRIRSGRARP